MQEKNYIVLYSIFIVGLTVDFVWAMLQSTAVK